MTYYDDILQEHLEVFQDLSQQLKNVEKIANVCCDALRKGNKLIFVGNGGSAADAQHIAAEFTGRFVNDRDPIAALALTTDTSALTSIGNDYGFEQVFSRQLKALGKSGDILFLISTSGNSKNINKILKVARQISSIPIALTGEKGLNFASLCDYSLIINSSVTARVQEAHIFVLHALCGLIERGLRYEQD